MSFKVRFTEGAEADLIIPFGATSCVALFEIDDSKTVTILAVRHQREDDYH